MRQKLPSKPASRTTSNPWERLTPREMDIVIALCAKHTRNSELATHLGIAENTIGIHLTNIYRKLECRNKAEIVLKALREGL